VPKIVDHEQRREDLGDAVWRVIRRDGVDGASVRRVAQEASCSPGSLRHYFASQSELIAFAMRLVVDRIEDRIAALATPEDPREAVEHVLFELLPLDDQRRAENEVWLAFAGRALIDPALRTYLEEIDDALRAACTSAIARLVGAGRAHPDIDEPLEAERLHALLDGLALHTATRPDHMSPQRIIAVVVRHLDSLDTDDGDPC
jgi:AcrR family transcriptional regulator